MITQKFANKICYSDVEPYEIVSQQTDNKITIREMDAKEEQWDKAFVPGGFSGTFVNQHQQKWTMTSNPSQPEKVIRRHKNGQWKDKHGNRYALADQPRKFYDFNF